MNREQIINYLKNGEWSAIANKWVYISYGQLSPDVQAVAREIGPKNFQAMDGFGSWDDKDEFCDGWAYRLRDDYEDGLIPAACPCCGAPFDKPKESEYEYLEIYSVEGEYRIPNRKFYLFAGLAPSLVGFIGYAKTLDQRNGFYQPFTPDMKYVVIKK